MGWERTQMQQGDGELVIQSIDGSYKKVIPRGYRDSISEDNRYVIFKIKPYFQYHLIPLTVQMISGMLNQIDLKSH